MYRKYQPWNTRHFLVTSHPFTSCFWSLGKMWFQSMRNMPNGQRVPFLMIACWAVSLSSAYGPATSWRLMTFKLKGSTNKIAWSREIPAVLESQHYAATSLPAANHTENHLESILDWRRLVAGKTEWQWEPGRLKRWHKTDPEVV